MNYKWFYSSIMKKVFVFIHIVNVSYKFDTFFIYLDVKEYFNYIVYTLIILTSEFFHLSNYIEYIQ